MGIPLHSESGGAATSIAAQGFNPGFQNPLKTRRAEPWQERVPLANTKFLVSPPGPW